MRRWNGWGDEAIEFALAPGVLEFLQQRIGLAAPPNDATMAQACRMVEETRLPPHPLVDVRPEIRVRHALGQSLSDWLKLRYGRIGATPDGVAFPESSAQVRELLDYAQGCDAIVIPYGGGTSVVGHLTVAAGSRPVLSVDLSRLSQLLDLDRLSQLASFGAGIAGPDLEAKLRAQGYTLGHFPQSFDYSTLGGWIVTRSSGQQSLRYGRIERMFAGGKLETPVGTLTMPTFPASAAGVDLREMVLGSEGRFGILTEATVRITPLPPREEFHAVFFPNWEQARTAARSIVQAGLPLSMLRLSNPLETLTALTLAGRKTLIGLLNGYLGWRGCGEQKCMMLIGASDAESVVEAALKGALRIARRHSGVHLGASLGEKWKHNRFRNVYLRNELWKHGYAIDTVETAVDWPRVDATMHAVEAAACAALAADGERVLSYTHLSHLYPEGASVYTTSVFRLSGDFEHDHARWRSMKTRICEAIVAHGGTISHQHGVGVDHAPYLAAEKGTLGVAAIRSLCRHFDPDGTMNPGKLLPVEG